MSKRDIWIRNLLDTLQRLEGIHFYGVQFWNSLNEARKKNSPTIELSQGGFQISVTNKDGKQFRLNVWEDKGRLQYYHHWGRRDEMNHGYGEKTVEAKRLYDDVISQLLEIK